MQQKTKIFSTGIRINNFSLVCINKMYGTYPVIQGQILKIIICRILNTAQIIDFHTGIQFYLSGIFLFKPLNFPEICYHLLLFQRPLGSKRQRSMRRYPISRKTGSNSRFYKFFHRCPAVTKRTMTMIIGQIHLYILSGISIPNIPIAFLIASPHTFANSNRKFFTSLSSSFRIEKSW